MAARKKKEPEIKKEPEKKELDLYEDEEDNNYDNTGEIRVISDDDTSDVAKAINAILGSDDFRTKTDLTKNEVRALAILLEIGGKIKSKRLLMFAENFMACMISFNRGSRKEVVASFGAMEAYGKKDVGMLGNLRLRE
jgi:hypothetical protein